MTPSTPKSPISHLGKSLYIKRLHEQLKTKLRSKDVPLKVVRLMERHAAVPHVLAALLPFLDTRYQKKPMLVHLDVTSAVSACAPWLVGGMGDWVSVA